MKYLNSIIIPILCLNCFSLHAQNAVLQWAINPTDQNPAGGNMEARGIVVDAAGNTYLAGYFQGTADFDPSPATANLYPTGGNSAFIAKYDAGGNYLWAKQMGGQYNTGCFDITLDVAGNIYVTGYFQGTTDFDPSPAVANLTAFANNDIFVAKYDANGNYSWAKQMGGTGGEEAYSLAFDAAGDLYLTGFFQGTADFDPSAATANLVSAGLNDAFLAKYSSNGDYIWAKAIGGSLTEYSYDLAVDAAGNAYITGYFSNTADFDPSATVNNLVSVAASADVFLAKYNSNGDYIWAVALGGNNLEIGNSLCLDAAGNIVVTGYFNGTADFDPSAATANLVSAGLDDIFIAKYNSNGNYVWAVAMGGTSYDSGSALTTDAANNIYLIGSFQGTADFDPSVATASLSSVGGSREAFIAKYDANGNYTWAGALGGLSDDKGAVLALDGDNNLRVAGIFQSTADFDPSAATANLTAGLGFNHIFLAKYTNNGTYLSAQLLGAHPNTGYIQESKSVATDAAGNVYLTGYFEGTVDFDPSPAQALLSSAGDDDIFIAKYDANGNYIWAKRIGSTAIDVGNSLAIDNAGNIYLTGIFQLTADFDPSAATANLTASGTTYVDVFIAKYDTNGNYLWAKRMGGTGVDISSGLALASNGDICITGYFSGTADFDPSAATANLVSSGSNSDVFVAKYTNDGNYIWAKVMNGSSADIGNSLDLDASDNVYITGYFIGNVDFDPSAATASLSSAGSSDVYLAKYDANGNYTWAKRIGGTGADVGQSLAVDEAGNAYLAGRFTGTCDFDPSATTANLTSAGNYDIFVAKYTANGDYSWAGRMGNTAEDRGNAIAVDAAGYVYLSGYFNGVVDFDPAAAVHTLVTPQGTDVFLAKYNTDGNYIWAWQMGGIANDLGYCLNLDANGDMLVAGNFGILADFDPLAPAFNLQSVNSTDAFLAKYNECPTPAPTGNASQHFCVAATVADLSAAGSDIRWYDEPNGGNLLASTTALTNGNQYYASQTDGCEAVNRLAVLAVINDIATGTDTQTACGSFTWLDGINYTNNNNSATYTFANGAANGCDSVVTLHLTISPLATGTDTQTACGSFTWLDGINYTNNNNSATYTFANGAANGCDSVVTLHLTISPLATGIDTQTACGSFTWLDGINYTNNNNTATYTFANGAANGCDSTVTLHLSITTIDTSLNNMGFSLMANQAGASYQWLDCNNGNAPIAGETSQTFSPSANGLYAVEIGINGCTAVSACAEIIGVGLQDVATAGAIRLYPNPTENLINIDFGQALANAALRLWAADGRRLQEHHITTEKQYTLSLSGYPAALYFVEIVANGKSTWLKIAKW